MKCLSKEQTEKWEGTQKYWWKGVDTVGGIGARTLYIYNIYNLCKSQ